MVLFIFCFGGGVLVVVGVLWWFSSNSFEILYGSLWIEVLFFWVCRVSRESRWTCKCHSDVPLIIVVVPGLVMNFGCWLKFGTADYEYPSSSTFHGWSMGLILDAFEGWFCFFIFFCYQWDTTSRGGVLSKLNRWRFQLLLTTVSSCGGCFDWYVVEVYTLVCTPPTRGFCEANI